MCLLLPNWIHIIDLLVECDQHDYHCELSSIEFKKYSISENGILQQQSKNIRINAALLNNINSITDHVEKSIIYMDWFGRRGYTAQIFRHGNCFIGQHISSLYVPRCLLELDSFRSTVTQLYKWKAHL